MSERMSGEAPGGTAAGGSLADVVDSLIAELHADMPSPRGAVLEAVGKQAVAAGD